MMSLFQPEVKIISTDNGYVLEWNRESPEDWQSVQVPRRKSRGVEVFTDRKKLLKRVNELL